MVGWVTEVTHFCARHRTCFTGSTMKLKYCLVFFLLNSVVATPLQGTFVRGLEILSQLIQPDHQLSSVFENLQQRLSQPPKPPKGEEDEGVSAIWSTLLQSFGMHSDQAPAAGVNILLFLAQMVSSSFSSNVETPEVKHPKPILETILNQPRISRLLSTMQNPKLSEIALEEAATKLSDQSSDCVMQLLCRGSPVIKGMQTSLAFFLNKPTVDPDIVKGETGSSDPEFSESDLLTQMKHSWKQQTPIERLFFFMPSLTDFESIGKLCKQKYNNC